MGLFDRLRKKDDLTRELEQFRAQAASPRGAETPVARTTASGALRIDDVFLITGRGVVATGQVITGSFQVGDSVEILRDGACVAVSTITGIEAFCRMLDRAEAGDHIGLLLRGVQRGQIARGDQVHAR